MYVVINAFVSSVIFDEISQGPLFVGIAFRGLEQGDRMIGHIYKSTEHYQTPRHGSDSSARYLFPKTCDHRFLFLLLTHHRHQVGSFFVLSLMFFSSSLFHVFSPNGGVQPVFPSNVFVPSHSDHQDPNTSVRE